MNLRLRMTLLFAATSLSFTTVNSFILVPLTIKISSSSSSQTHHHNRKLKARIHPSSHSLLSNQHHSKLHASSNPNPNKNTEHLNIFDAFSTSTSSASSSSLLPSLPNLSAVALLIFFFPSLLQTAASLLISLTLSLFVITPLLLISGLWLGSGMIDVYEYEDKEDKEEEDEGRSSVEEWVRSLRESTGFGGKQSGGGGSGRNGAIDVEVVEDEDDCD